MIGEHRDGDVLARPTFYAVQKTIGTATGRKYGRVNSNSTVWVDPRDIAAKPGEWEIIPDWVAQSPTANEIGGIVAQSKANASAAQRMAARVASAGVRVWSDPPQKIGMDMQQAPGEAGAFLAAMVEAGVKTVLEVGTGESGGFARFMISLGWRVVSIDLNAPKFHGGLSPEEAKAVAARWTFVQANTRDIVIVEDEAAYVAQGGKVNIASDALPAFGVPDGGFDLVFIDAGHEYEDAQHDWEKFAPLGKIVAMHDIAPDSWFKGSVQFWRDTAYENGVLQTGGHEAVQPQSRAGIGWVEEAYNGWRAKPAAPELPKPAPDPKPPKPTPAPRQRSTPPKPAKGKGAKPK